MKGLSEGRDWAKKDVYKRQPIGSSSPSAAPSVRACTSKSPSSVTFIVTVPGVRVMELAKIMVPIGLSLIHI